MKQAKEGLSVGNYTELYYHFVWATKRREAYITPKVEQALHDLLRHKCRILGVKVHPVNGMPDHVHLACSLPTPLAIADFMETIKGASAHAVNQKAQQENDLQMCLYWQPGFGALTLAEDILPRIVRYVDNQKRHHAEGRLSPRLERCDDGHPDSSAPKGVHSE